MFCPKCGDTLQVREFDYGTCRETGYRDAGEYNYCETCRTAVDEGDAILVFGPEVEALREAQEEQISQRQYDAWIDEAEGAGGAA